MANTYIELKKLVYNTGQIEGVPRNPRKWTKEDVTALAASIVETPELFEARPLLVVPSGDRYIVIGGNMRLAAARELAMSAPPCYEIENRSTENLKRMALKDNASFGEWDTVALADEWPDCPLAEWGIVLPPAPVEEQEEEQEIEGNAGGYDGDDEPARQTSVEPIPEVEALLNEAMRENVREFYEQVKCAQEHGWLLSGYTIGLARARFLRAKYYGNSYPGVTSLVFCPHRFFTSANSCSIPEQMERIIAGSDAGIPGFRTFTGDGLLTKIMIGGCPIAGSRMPMDFPALVARDLYREFGGEGARVLDPCHGWGGRLVGALLADVRHYCGIDPDPDTHRGVQLMADTFLDYCKETTVELIEAPFEDVVLDEGVYDMALTSPPYFDVEQYRGGEQAHEKFPKYDLWVAGFYRPLIAKTYGALRPGGHFCLQVGSQSYPLRDDALRIAPEVGFSLVEERPLNGGTISSLHNQAGKETNEMILIFRK